MVVDELVDSVEVPEVDAFEELLVGELRGGLRGRVEDQFAQFTLEAEGHELGVGGVAVRKRISMLLLNTVLQVRAA